MWFKKSIGIKYIYKLVLSNRYYLYNKNAIVGSIECKHIKLYREFYDRCTKCRDANISCC